MTIATATPTTDHDLGSMPVKDRCACCGARILWHPEKPEAWFHEETGLRQCTTNSQRASKPDAHPDASTPSDREEG